MSEYQYIHFMALDKPLDDKQLEYMERQSSRAEITRWEFTNEYNFGDFHGNAEEMLRRGYDVHVHFANFGLRKLMIRLPDGPPCDRRMFESFLVESNVEWIADKQGKGGILCIEPADEENFYEYLDRNLETLLADLAPIRKMLIEGDLRPLYLAWLACRAELEEDAMEPPVPAGLQKLPPALKEMAEFYCIEKNLVSAAAEQSPEFVASSRPSNAAKEWLDKQSEMKLRSLAEKLLSEDGQSVRAETLARIRQETDQPAWPTEKPSRTISQLIELSKEIGGKRQRKEKLADEAARRKRLKEIAADPKKLVEKVEKLVKERSTDSYRKAAQELADLREAIGPEFGQSQAQAVAEKLRRENPKLRMLISALKREGLLG